jgi:hypothetical protein
MGQYFRLHGLGGFLIAVALLLTILVVLVTSAVSVQAREATNPYKISDPLQIKKFDPANKDLRVMAN